MASILLLSITLNNKKLNLSYIPWVGLSLIFLFLSIEEISLIHGRLEKPIKELVGAAGLLYYAWVIPCGLALVVFIISYTNFLLKLPKKS